MMSLKELLVLALALVVLAFSNSYFNVPLFAQSLIFFAIILAVYTSAKKLTAYYYEADEETRIWTAERFGLGEWAHLRMPIPIGILLAFFLPIMSFGAIPWFALTESEVRPTEVRAVRRHDFFSFAEMTEWHLAMISAAGIASMFLIVVLAYIFNYPVLAKLSIYYAAFNLLPLGKLDGSKVFFGSYILYAIIAAVTLIALAYVVLLV